MPDVPAPIVIKQYDDRLYDTARGRYVTPEDLAIMIRDGERLAVHDARTGQDITRSALTHLNRKL
jgi:polyhydroxyalkanoate synthesis regulator protein